MSAMGHPAAEFGRITRESGERIFAVSAMKRTPQKTMRSALYFCALTLSSRESPQKSAMSWIAPST